MNSLENNKKNKDLIILSMITVITGYLGIVGFPVLLLVYPAFSIVLGRRYGLKQNIINMFLSLILLSIALGFQYIPILIGFLLVSITQNMGMNKRERSYNIIVKGTCLLFLSTVVFVFMLYEFYDINIVSEIGKALNETFSISIKQVEEMKIEVPYSIGELKKLSKEYTKMTLIAFPSIIVLFSALINIVSYQIAYLFLRKNGNKRIEPLKLGEFRLPRKFSSFIILTIIFMLVVYIIDKLLYDNMFTNISIVVAILVFVQGLGVISYFLDKLSIGKSKLLKTIIIIFIVFSPFLAPVITITGITDVLFNFRRLKEQ